MFPIRRNSVREDSVLFLKRAYRFARELFFPGTCLLCKAPISEKQNVTKQRLHGQVGANQHFRSWVCPSCLDAQGLFPFEEPYCTLCGHEFTQGTSHVCQECLRHPPLPRKIRAAFWYQGVITKLLPLYKYQGKLCLTQDFAQALFEAYCRHFSSPEPDIIIPIPLHGTRLFSRKYNQAYLLVDNFSQQYADRFQKPPKTRIDLTSLVRVRATNYQTGFDKKERRKNMKNAFLLAPGAEEKLKGKYILLVDDVYTSGATCREAAKVLLRGKTRAQRVDVLTLARA